MPRPVAALALLAALAAAAPAEERRPDSLGFVRASREWVGELWDYSLPPVAPEPGVSVHYREEYFDVFGDGAEGVERGLIAATAELGAREGVRGLVLGLCQAQPITAYEVIQEGGACWLGRVVVYVPTRVVLPRWRGRGDAALKARWEHYVWGIRGHELSHQAVAIREANALKRELAELGTVPCAGIHRAVAAVEERARLAIRRGYARYHERVESPGVLRRPPQVPGFREGL